MRVTVCVRTILRELCGCGPYLCAYGLHSRTVRVRLFTRYFTGALLRSKISYDSLFSPFSEVLVETLELTLVPVMIPTRTLPLESVNFTCSSSVFVVVIGLDKVGLLIPIEENFKFGGHFDSLDTSSKVK